MPNKKKLDFDVKRYLVAEVLYPDHVVPLHVGECNFFVPILQKKVEKHCFSVFYLSYCNTLGLFN